MRRLAPTARRRRPYDEVRPELSLTEIGHNQLALEQAVRGFGRWLHELSGGG